MPLRAPEGDHRRRADHGRRLRRLRQRQSGRDPAIGFGRLAVLIDATIVRCVLVPASMKLLGDWNWYLPSWLGWLPDPHVEREAVK